MATAAFNHGSRVIDASSQSRSLEVADYSSIGACVTAPDADVSIPRNEPFAFYTHDTEMVAKLGETGTAIELINAVKAQGIEAQLVLSLVEAGADADATRTAMVGSAATMTGLHALSYARGHVGVEPDFIIAPGFASGRIEGAKNPVADVIQQVATKLKAIGIADTGGPDVATSLVYRSDFDSRYMYLVDPFVKTAGGIKPASAFAAAMFVKRDKQKGGPYWSPSNQEVLGVLGTARPISYFAGDVDHEANQLNKEGIATFIPSRLVQDKGGKFASNGRILWGNRTTSSDTLWAFVNVVRTRAAIEKVLIDGFRWANDENLSAQHIFSVMRTAQSLLDELKAVGAILGGQVFWDRDKNPNANLRLGKLRVEFDAEETPPLEDLIWGSRRNENYFDNLANDVRNMMSVSFSTQISDLAA